MELTRLIAALSDPAAYPGPAPVDAVVVHQTHISVVFVAGPYVYKIKKPVTLGFLDYATLARRLHFCEQEVLLNRRLAPSVYLGVVPVVKDGDVVRMEGRGEVVEWAVKMERLPEDATLRERLRLGAVDEELVGRVARRIADFHARADAGPAVSAFGRFAVVASNARDNFTQSSAHIGATIHSTVFERLRSLTEAALAAHRSTIEARAERGVARDGHGDLRLDHVYVFPDREPPGDLVVVDAIEFNERFRCGDPVSDVAFLVMDLSFERRRDLAQALANSYFEASGDAEGVDLLPFYTSYRAAVRGKVEGMKSLEPEVPEGDRAEALTRARALWLLALGELEEADRRPALVLVGGLPGTGKSTLARALAERAGFDVIRSDLVRKELADRAGARASAAAFEAGIYTPEWTERTYSECLRRAESRLFEGRRVLVDASFGTEANRRRFLDLAGRSGVPALLLICRADPGVVERRLDARQGDASDADWSIYQRASSRWEAPGPLTPADLRPIETAAGIESSLAQALDFLRQRGLVGR